MGSKKTGLIAVVALILCLALSACGKGETVVTVNGEKIAREDFEIYLNQVKMQIEQQQKDQQQNTDNSDDFWETAEVEGKKAIDTAKEKALDEVVKAALIRQKAKENDMKIDDNDKSTIEQQKSRLTEQFGSKEAFEAELAKQGLTEKFYNGLLEESMYAQKLTGKYAGDVTEEAARVFYNEKISHVKHILFMTVDPQTNEPLPKEQQDAAMEKSKTTLALAQSSGADFDALVAEYSEDKGMTEEGYYVGEGFIFGSQGAMVTPFEKASLELKVGEVSNIVESVHGYHIIKRLENAPEKFDANKEEAIFRAKNARFFEILEQWKSEAKIEINEESYGAIK